MDDLILVRTAEKRDFRKVFLTQTLWKPQIALGTICPTWKFLGPHNSVHVCIYMILNDSICTYMILSMFIYVYLCVSMYLYMCKCTTYVYVYIYIASLISHCWHGCNTHCDTPNLAVFWWVACTKRCRSRSLLLFSWPRFGSGPSWLATYVLYT